MIDAGTYGPHEEIRLPERFWTEAPLDQISYLRDGNPIPGFKINLQEDVITREVIVRRRPLIPTITTVTTKAATE